MPKPIQLPLEFFRQIVQEYEELPGSEEQLFWTSSDALGNYLASPFSQDHARIAERFLEAWRSVRRRIAWERMRELWTPEMQALMHACAEHSLPDADLSANVLLGTHTISLRRAIEALFGRLTLVPGLGATNASKLLSLSAPAFFVMWDSLNVRQLNGMRDTPRSYSQFIETMQAYSRKLIEEAAAEQGCSKESAVRWMEDWPLDSGWKTRVPRSKPMAKLLDEYNYQFPKSAVFKELTEKLPG